jgi:hypothetical protein
MSEPTVYKDVTIKGRQENKREKKGERKKAGIRDI